MAVAAGVVGDPFVATLETPFDMTAEHGCATGGQVVQRPPLLGREMTTVLGQERLSVKADHIGHFQCQTLGRYGHGRTSAGAGSASRSSRLGVCRRRWVLTCR